jgi:RNA polymerase sigma-70 factor (ECF subfamily)
VSLPPHPLQISPRLFFLVIASSVSPVVEPTSLLDEGSDLLAGLLAGDEAVFAAVVDGWSAAMLRVAQRYVRNPHSAQDVVQETWLTVIQNLHRFEQRSSLRTWVFGILINTARARGGRAGRRQQADVFQPTVDPRRFRGRSEPDAGGWTAAGAPTSWAPPPESAVVADETRQLIMATIDGLAEPGRTVILLRDVEGLPAAETCALLDITAANQRVLLHRARSKVRQALEDYYRGDGG